MKPIIQASIILIVIITSGILISNYTSKSAEHLKKITQEIEQKIAKEDWKNAKEKNDDFEEIWNNYKSIWTVIMDHSEVYNIEMLTALIKGYIKAEERKEALAQSEELKRTLTQVIEKQQFTLSNIL